jgi:hypothetical protein
MRCLYCGADDDLAPCLTPLYYLHMDCKRCGAEIVMEVTVLKQPDASKLFQPIQ